MTDKKGKGQMGPNAKGGGNASRDAYSATNSGGGAQKNPRGSGKKGDPERNQQQQRKQRGTEQ